MDALHFIPAVALTTTLGLAGAMLSAVRLAALFSRRRARRQAMQSRQLLAALRMAMAALENRLGDIDAGDSAAQRSRLQSVNDLVAGASLELNDCLSAFSQWQNAQPSLPAHPARRLAALLWEYPAACRRHERELQQIDQHIARLQKRLSRIRRAIEQARRQPADISRRVQAAQGAVERASQTAQSLQDDGAHNEFVAQVSVTLDTYAAALQSLNALAAEQTPESARAASQQLDALEANLLDVTRSIEEWQASRSRLNALLAQIESEAQAAGALAGESIPADEVAVYDRQRETLLAQAREIRQRIPRSTTAALNGLIQTAEQLLSELRSIARDMALLQEWRRDASASIAAVLSKADDLRETMRALSQAEQLPIIWDRSETELVRALTPTDTVSIAPDAGDARYPFSRKAALESAEAQILALDAQVRAVANHRSQLIAALDNPEIAGRGKWAQRAVAIQAAAYAYAPDNWPPRDSVVSLKSDIAMLAGIQTELEPIFGLQPVRESQIALWLDRVNTYVRDRRALHARLDRIESELQSIQNAEQSSKDLVSGALNLLAGLPADATQPGSDSEVGTAWRNLSALWQEGEDLADALERRLVGRVAEKALAVEEWAHRCADNTRRLLVALETDCRDIWESLRRQIARVTRLAPLNLEPSLIIANRLAETPLRFPAGSDGRHPNASDLAIIEKRAEQITSALELHARLHRALREFDRQIVAVIGARPDYILAQRQAATEMWETLESLRSRALELTQIPVSCAEVDQIEQRFLAAENAWIELAQEGRTVKAMVARLDNLIEQYSAICAQGRDLRTRLESQAAQFRLAWDRFALWRRRLQRYRDQHLNDHQLVAAINSRLAELEKSVARLRENYAEAPPTIDRAPQEIDRILRESYRDVEINRGGRTEKVPAHAITPIES